MDHRARVEDRQVGARRLLLVEAEEPERVLWRHEVDASPFERLLRESTTEIALAAGATGGTKVAVTLDQRPRGWARFSPFQLRAAARRQAEAALDGLAGLLGDERLMRWWGWGEDGHAVPLLARRRGPAGRRARRRPERAEAARAVRAGVACPSPACPRRCASGSRQRSAPRACATTARRAWRTRSGARIPISSASAPGDASSAPDAVLLPDSAELVAAVLGLCAEHRVAVVPFGGGTSVVGGVEPVREGFAGVVSLDLGRLSATVDVDRTSLTARARRRPAGPGAGAAAARGGRDARPLPAVVRVLDRSAAGWPRAPRARPRPDTGASTSWSRRCAA